MDKFVKKRKTDEEEPSEKQTKIANKSPLKEKKAPISLEQKKENPKAPTITEKKAKEDPNSKFYSSYESFIDNLESWKVPLKSFINPPNNNQMKSIYNFVKKEYETKIIFPPKNLIFNAFSKTPWDKVKVVIIGQDPYPNPGDAMGLSFSVPKTQRIPGSLNNIYKCLENDKKLKFIKPKHGDLSSWAEQGVFLINATLTVECKKANSHQKNSGWAKFTDFVIKQISLQKKNIVFLLWGNFAIAKSSLIDKNKHLIIKNIHQKNSGWAKFTDFVIKQISLQKKNIVFLLWGNFAIAKSSLIDKNKHLIIKNIHPSPLAQSKGDFSKSEQFSQTNEYLEKNGLEPINWEIK